LQQKVEGHQKAQKSRSEREKDKVIRIDRGKTGSGEGKTKENREGAKGPYKGGKKDRGYQRKTSTTQQLKEQNITKKRKRNWSLTILKKWGTGGGGKKNKDGTGSIG